MIRRPGRERVRHAAQPADGEAVHADVGPVVEQAAGAGGVGRACDGRVELRVLKHRERAGAGRKDADALAGVRLGDGLGAHLRAAAAAVSEEERVGDAREDVVDAVHVHTFHTARLHVREAARPVQRHVDPAVAIRRFCDAAVGLHDDLAFLGKARQEALLEKVHLVTRKPKEAGRLKVRERLLVGEAAGHDVPLQRLHDGLRPCSCRCQQLHLLQALSLDLEQRHARWQAHVVAALWSGAAQPSALPTSKQQHRRAPLRNHLKAGPSPLRALLAGCIRERQHRL
mmetsp:Transcript_24122/g.71584  ORF Transcript_24122/g.71584 Transcript_24122/m.71584 type:complete len:285 (-) Transcript_24122:349-1203(-)